MDATSCSRAHRMTIFLPSARLIVWGSSPVMPWKCIRNWHTHRCFWTVGRCAGSENPARLIVRIGVSN
jgi:hypothetical protein